jgi:hypothetical protein
MHVGSGHERGPKHSHEVVNDTQQREQAEISRQDRSQWRCLQRLASAPPQRRLWLKVHNHRPSQAPRGKLFVNKHLTVVVSAVCLPWPSVYVMQSLPTCVGATANSGTGCKSVLQSGRRHCRGPRLNPRDNRRRASICVLLLAVTRTSTRGKNVRLVLGDSQSFIPYHALLCGQLHS